MKRNIKSSEIITVENSVIDGFSKFKNHYSKILGQNGESPIEQLDGLTLIKETEDTIAFILKGEFEEALSNILKRMDQNLQKTLIWNVKKNGKTNIKEDHTNAIIEPLKHLLNDLSTTLNLIDVKITLITKSSDIIEDEE